ncbi:hypothetical protein RND71_025339 [Anisodus tanguticus]|uniref:Uncharacterized protein n=1 Tax=Anisodus tanguticus TaxID=243964 RepID=A0AAE1RR74_9SOLA|nr:hypothetical protein RND71_025339 [Anisodus tanguticus]
MEEEVAQAVAFSQIQWCRHRGGRGGVRSNQIRSEKENRERGEGDGRREERDSGDGLRSKRVVICEEDGGSSCGYWRWEDEEYYESCIGELMSSFDAFKNEIADSKNEIDTLNEEIVELKGINQAEMNKVLKMRVFMMISWALFVGFVAASIMK